jgi:hypothetical protein
MSRRIFVLFLIGAGVARLMSIESAQATTTSVATTGNVLAGATAVSSTVIAPGFPTSHSVDDLVRAVPPEDQDHGLIFDNADPSQRLGLTGSFGAIDEIRIWTIFVPVDNRIPNSVTVRSSLNSLGGAALINAANFETALGIFPLGAGAFTGIWPNTDTRYATVLVDAPAGTQSLLLSFGGVADGKGERISEVQAFVPEPSTMTIVGMTVIGMGIARRRRRTI